MKPDISLATKSAFLLANDKYGLATTHPESGCGSCKPGNIAAMDELRPSASAAGGDEQYREEWSCFCAERRRLRIRLFWFASGLAVSALLLVATLGDHHPPLVLRIVIAVSFGLFSLRPSHSGSSSCGRWRRGPVRDVRSVSSFRLLLSIRSLLVSADTVGCFC